MMNTVLSCQDQYFAGGQSYDCPYFSTSTVDVSKDTWVSLWPSGILDNKSENQDPQTPEQLYNVDCTRNDAHLLGDKLSSQMYKNKRLQDTLVQREEEVARLNQENNKLKQYLSSNFVKCLEEKTKRLLSQHAIGAPQKRKLKPRGDASEESKLKKAKRNLMDQFTTCEEHQKPAVDTWVLQTLGLKDVNTIDDSMPANYNAMPSDPGTKVQGAESCSMLDAPLTAAHSDEPMPSVHSASSWSQAPTYCNASSFFSLGPPQSNAASSCKQTAAHSHTAGPYNLAHRNIQTASHRYAASPYNQAPINAQTPTHCHAASLSYETPTHCHAASPSYETTTHSHAASPSYETTTHSHAASPSYETTTHSHAASPSYETTTHSHAASPSYETTTHSHAASPSYETTTHSHAASPSYETVTQCHAVSPSYETANLSHAASPSYETATHCHAASPYNKTPNHTKTSTSSHTASFCSQDSLFLDSPPNCNSVSLPSSQYESPGTCSTNSGHGYSLKNTQCAFFTSLTVQHTVKTHTFDQGQAFVLRGEGGWKFTWMPRSE